MTFLRLYTQSLAIIMTMMTLLWLVSVRMKNVSIVDLFWGIGFLLVSIVGFINAGGLPERKILVMTLVAIWSLRLSFYLVWRNYGKGEDFRYQQFRKQYGEKRYWWISLFQTFLLQGMLMWLIAAPLLAALHFGPNRNLGWLDVTGIVFWVIGIIFEAGGDFQLARFRSDPDNRGKVLQTGLWRYTRHPNYFGDTAVWWGYGFLCLAAGSILPVLGCLLMTGLIIRVSGVALLEKSLVGKKPGYAEYVRKTSAFIPWFPKK